MKYVLYVPRSGDETFSHAAFLFSRVKEPLSEVLHRVAFEVQIRRAVCMFGFQRITLLLYILIGAC